MFRGTGKRREGRLSGALGKSYKKSNMWLYKSTENIKMPKEGLQNEKKIADAAVPDGSFSEMNRSVYKGAAELGPILDDCGTLPFMAEKKLVLLRDSGLFFQGRKADSDAMNSYLSSLPETTVLVFTEEKVDKRSTLYKTVKKLGECLEFQRLKDSELADFIKKQCKNGIDCPEYFVAEVGNDIEKLLGELKKAQEYAGNRTITKQDIDDVCSKSLDTYIFNMTKAVGQRNTAEALEIYGNMLTAKESPLGILNMLARQLRYTLECKHLAAKGKNAAYIAEQLGMRDWQIKNYIAQARNFTNAELLNGLNACYNCDTDIKTGKINDVLGVELVIVGLGGKKQ